MKRILLFIICICILVLSSCGSKTGNTNNIVASEEVTDSGVTDDYLSNLQENYDPSETEEETEALFPMPSSAYMELKITDLEDRRIQSMQKYSGERMTFKLSTYISEEKEDGPQNFNGVFFILIDGYLQPFYFGDSEEEVLYASLSEASSEEFSEYTFSFDPIYAPYGDTAYVSFILSFALDYLQETNNVMMSPYEIINNCRITSATEECAVEYEKIKNTLEINTDFDCKGSVGFNDCITTKLTSINQLRINTFFDTDEQLYMTTVSNIIESKDVRAFAVVDGKLANLFGGKYYVDFRQEPRVAYEVPLDMNYFTKDKRHQVYFIKINWTALEGKEASGEGTDLELVYCVTVR